MGPMVRLCEKFLIASVSDVLHARGDTTAHTRNLLVGFARDPLAKFITTILFKDKMRVRIHKTGGHEAAFCRYLFEVMVAMRDGSFSEVQNHSVRKGQPGVFHMSEVSLFNTHPISKIFCASAANKFANINNKILLICGVVKKVLWGLIQVYNFASENKSDLSLKGLPLKEITESNLAYYIDSAKYDFSLKLRDPRFKKAEKLKKYLLSLDDSKFDEARELIEALALSNEVPREPSLMVPKMNP